MIDALYIAESGLTARQKQLDAIAHNITNLSTPGFKAQHTGFINLVQVQRNEQGEIRSSAGIGVVTSQPQVDFAAGSMQPTGRALDLAIAGDGFLEVQLPDGQIRYSRGGRLQLDQEGYLATAEGHRLAAGIQVPPDTQRLVIQPGGLVMAELADKQQLELGQLQLSVISQSQLLTAVGSNLYELAAQQQDVVRYQQPGEQGAGQLQQGVLEGSNVSMNQEMTDLMLAQRGYQLNARLVQVSDQIMEVLNNLRR
jgi:flagellar basal-body rod protein FlgG